MRRDEHEEHDPRATRAIMAVDIDADADDRRKRQRQRSRPRPRISIRVPAMSEAPRFSPPGPGPEHKVFEKDVGTWDADIMVRFPGMPPMPSRGVYAARLACGSLW